MTTNTPILTLMTVLCLAVPAGASGDLDHCGAKYTTVAAGTETLYFVEVTFPGTPLPWLVVYLESNGADGFQRGGEDALGNTDPCPGSNPDTLVGLVF